MKSWDLMAIAVHPHAPEILESGDGGRAILLEIPSGESLSDHHVHEHAWVSVVDGRVELASEATTLTGAAGTVFELNPGERHSVRALETARLLLVLSPWPGLGHPGAMALADKQTVRQRAAEYRRHA